MLFRSGPGNSLSSTDDTSTNSDFYPVFVAGTGSQTPKIGTTKLKFNPSTGDLSAAGNITAYFSDNRLKDRLENISEPLAKISKLNGFYFVPNETAVALGYEQKKDIGVSAQEVDEVLPEAITSACAAEGYLAVRYERLIPLLIESVKELSNLNDQRSAEIKELQQSIAALLNNK